MESGMIILQTFRNLIRNVGVQKTAQISMFILMMMIEWLYMYRDEIEYKYQIFSEYNGRNGYYLKNFR